MELFSRTSCRAAGEWKLEQLNVEMGEKVHKEEQLDRKVKMELVDNVDVSGLDPLVTDTITEKVAHSSNNSVLCYVRSPCKVFLKDHNYSLMPCLCILSDHSYCSLSSPLVTYQEYDYGDGFELGNGDVEETGDVRPDIHPELETLSSGETKNDGDSLIETIEIETESQSRLGTPTLPRARRWGDRAEKLGGIAFRQFLRQLGKSESYLTEYTRKDLDEVLATFWNEVRREDGSEVGVVTLCMYSSGLQKILIGNTNGPARRCNIFCAKDFPISCAAFEARLESLKDWKRIRTQKKEQEAIQDAREVVVRPEDPLGSRESTRTASFLEGDCDEGIELGNGELKKRSDLRQKIPLCLLGRTEKWADFEFRHFLRTHGRSESYLTEYTREDLDEVLARFWREARREVWSERGVTRFYSFRYDLRRILEENADGPAAHCVITVPAEFPISCAAFKEKVESLKEQAQQRLQKRVRAERQATIQEEREGTVNEEREVTVAPEDPLGFCENTWTATVCQKRDSDFGPETDIAEEFEDEEMGTRAVGRGNKVKTERRDSLPGEEGHGVGSSMPYFSQQIEDEEMGTRAVGRGNKVKTERRDSLPGEEGHGVGSSMPYFTQQNESEPRRKRQKTEDSGVVLKEEEDSASECGPGNANLSSDEDFVAKRNMATKGWKKNRCEDPVILEDENPAFVPETTLSSKEIQFFRVLEHFIRKQEICFSLSRDSKKDLDMILAAFWKNLKKDDGSELRSRKLISCNGNLSKFFRINKQGLVTHWNINNPSDFPLAAVAFKEKLRRLRAAEEEEDLADSQSAASRVRKRKGKEVNGKRAFDLLEKFLLGQGRSTCVTKDYSKEELDDILADFWLSATKQNGSDFRANSLKSYRSSLRVALRANKDGPAAFCDINNSSDFPRSSMAFSERFRDLIAFEDRRGPENYESRLSSSEKADSHRTTGVNVLRKFLDKQGRSFSDIERCTKEDLDEILGAFWRSLETKDGLEVSSWSLSCYKHDVKKFFSANKYGPAAYCDIDNAIEFPYATAAFKERQTDLKTAEIEKRVENFDNAASSIIKKKKKERRIEVAVCTFQKFVQTEKRSAYTSVLEDYSKEDLDELLASFWSMAKKRDGSEFRATTLRGYYTLLGIYFRENKEGPIALSNILDPTCFPKSFEAYNKRYKTLKTAEIEELGIGKKRDSAKEREMKVVSFLHEFLRKQGKSERFLTDYTKKDLDAVLADFWLSLFRKDGKVYRVTTLRCYRLALGKKFLRNPDGLAPHCDLSLAEDFPKSTSAFKERVRSLREREELMATKDTQKEETVGSERESERMDLCADSFSEGPSIKRRRRGGEIRPEARGDTTGYKKISEKQRRTRRNYGVGRTTNRLQEQDSASESESEESDISEDDDWEPEISEDKK